jgi:hypothetical protein
MMPPTTLQQLTTVAQAVLDEAVAILDTTVAEAPESQFLTATRPAIDCEFVAVQVSRITEDTTSPLGITETKKRNAFGNIILATFVIWVVRCGPDISGGLPPSDAGKTANATIVQEDAWALWNGFRDAQDVLFDGCLGVYFDGGTPVQESGGFVGWTFQIRASIEGYLP